MKATKRWRWCQAIAFRFHFRHVFEILTTNYWYFKFFYCFSVFIDVFGVQKKLETIFLSDEITRFQVNYACISNDSVGPISKLFTARQANLSERIVYFLCSTNCFIIESFIGSLSLVFCLQLRYSTPYDKKTWVQDFGAENNNNIHICCVLLWNTEKINWFRFVFASFIKSNRKPSNVNTNNGC